MFLKSNLLQQKRKLLTELQKWFYDMTENQKIHYWDSISKTFDEDSFG